MFINDMTVVEMIALDATAAMRSVEGGYLVAAPRVARTGIQIYGGDEVGRPEMNRVRVYRPEAEVFSKDAMASIAHRPITNDHPGEPVTADNWSKFAVGQLDGEIARDGDFVRVPMMVMDGKTIRDIEAGKKALSLGYVARLEWRSGVTDRGEAFDAVQTGIRVNHLAIVDAARGGAKLVIGDRSEIADQGEVVMSDKIVNLKTMIVDGITVEMSDTAAQVVQRALQLKDASAEELKKKIAEMEAMLKKMGDNANDAKAASDKAIGTKDAEIVTLKKQLEDAKLTPAKLDVLVKDRAEVIAKCRAVIGDELVVDGKDDTDMRRQVVAKKLGDACKDWSADQLKASFDTLTAGIDVTKQPNAADAMARTFSGAPVGGSAASVAKEKAYDAYDARIQDAWKGDQQAK